MISLLADVNIQGHVAYLAARMQSDAWREFWEHLDCRHLSFAEVGLHRADSDLVIWQRCQERGLFLLTNNRNDEGPDSLHSAIRTNNNELSLPVFTIGDTERLLHDSEYADRVIDRLYQYLFEQENIRGTERLFVP